MYDGEWRRAAGAARAEVLGGDGTRLPPGDPVPAEFRDYFGRGAAAERRPTLGAVTGSVWEAFAAAEPDADFTRIYPFVAGD
jgi:hypothetical protein